MQLNVPLSSSDPLSVTQRYALVTERGPELDYTRSRGVSIAKITVFNNNSLFKFRFPPVSWVLDFLALAATFALLLNPLRPCLVKNLLSVWAGL